MAAERCYVCGRAEKQVAEAFEDDIAEAKKREIAHAKVGDNEPNHADVYTEEEYEIAKACQELAPDLLSTPLDEYGEQRESLSRQYRGLETLDQVLRIPFKKNPTGIGGQQKRFRDRIAAIVGTYEKAREIDRVRSKKRQQIEEKFESLPNQVEWIRQIPMKLRRSDGADPLPNGKLKVPICIACAAWEPELQALKDNPYPW